MERSYLQPVSSASWYSSFHLGVFLLPIAWINSSMKMVSQFIHLWRWWVSLNQGLTLRLLSISSLFPSLRRKMLCLMPVAELLVYIIGNKIGFLWYIDRKSASSDISNSANSLSLTDSEGHAQRVIKPNWLLPLPLYLRNWTKPFFSHNWDWHYVTWVKYSAIMHVTFQSPKIHPSFLSFYPGRRLAFHSDSCLFVFLSRDKELLVLSESRCLFTLPLLSWIDSPVYELTKYNNFPVS